MENLFETGNPTPFEEFAMGLALLQPLIILFQLLCSAVRWGEYSRSKTIKRRLVIYWLLMVLYIASVPASLFSLVFPGNTEYVYFSYWLISAYYCTHITMPVNRKRITAMVQR